MINCSLTGHKPNCKGYYDRKCNIYGVGAFIKENRAIFEFDN